MVKVSFKTSIEFEDETWEAFQEQWTMPSAFLHSILKSVFSEGFKSKYGVQPKTIGIFPLGQDSKVEPERVDS